MKVDDAWLDEPDSAHWNVCHQKVQQAGDQQVDQQPGNGAISAGRGAVMRMHGCEAWFIQYVHKRTPGQARLCAAMISEETGHCAERLIALGGPAIQNPVIVFPYIEGLHEFVRDRRWAPRFTIR
ncbi:hypothetical protein Pta6605_29240 [Pseudomonas amygdali pv. tabaci]|nr:hypothetical protein Pta6605_29240 [Pseudomonas amygdali pv. tabaci]